MVLTTTAAVGGDSTLCSGVLYPQSSLWTRCWGWESKAGHALPWIWYCASSPFSGHVIFWLQGMGGVVPFGPDATVSPREAILSVANHGPTSIRTSGQRGSRSGPRCLLGFADWPRTSGGMRAPPLGFPLVLPLCPGSPWPAVGGIVFLPSWHILGNGLASLWSSAGRGLWAPSRQAGERVSAGGGEGAA